MFIGTGFFRCLFPMSQRPLSATQPKTSPVSFNLMQRARSPVIQLSLPLRILIIGAGHMSRIRLTLLLTLCLLACTAGAQPGVLLVVEHNWTFHIRGTCYGVLQTSL